MRENIKHKQVIMALGLYKAVVQGSRGDDRIATAQLLREWQRQIEAKEDHKLGLKVINNLLQFFEPNHIVFLKGCDNL